MKQCRGKASKLFSQAGIPPAVYEDVWSCRFAKDSRQRIRAGPLGLGLLLGLAVLSYGLQCGCTTAEILAINDDGKLCWADTSVDVQLQCFFDPNRRNDYPMPLSRCNLEDPI